MPQPGDTVNAYGLITGPTLGQQIGACATALLPIGPYKIETVSYTSGTTTATDSDNMQLLANGVAVRVLPSAQGSNAVSANPLETYLSLTVPTVLSINAIAAGGGTAGYHAEIAATMSGAHIGVA
jgi:hypothetical protein